MSAQTEIILAQELALADAERAVAVISTERDQARATIAQLVAVAGDVRDANARKVADLEVRVAVAEAVVIELRERMAESDARPRLASEEAAHAQTRLSLAAALAEAAKPKAKQKPVSLPPPIPPKPVDLTLKIARRDGNGMPKEYRYDDLKIEVVRRDMNGKASDYHVSNA